MTSLFTNSTNNRVSKFHWVSETPEYTLGIHSMYTPRVKIQASLTEYGIPLRVYEHGLTMRLQKEREGT